MLDKLGKRFDYWIKTARNYRRGHENHKINFIKFKKNTSKLSCDIRVKLHFRKIGKIQKKGKNKKVNHKK